MSRKVIGLLNLYSSPTLGPLTQNRTLGSTSFLGRFAVMDFALSNFTHSGIDDFSILVKDHFRSVSKHVGSMKTWVNNTKIAKQYILFNEKGLLDKTYNTELNNLRENEWLFFDTNPDYVVIQPAHIISLVDFDDALNFHIKKGADITVVYTKIKNADVAFNYGNVIEVDKEGKISHIIRNTGEKKTALVSMESYIISKEALKKLIHQNAKGRGLSLNRTIVKLIRGKTCKVFGYGYEGFVRSIDSYQHFCEYSLELLKYDVATQLFDAKDWTVYTVTHNSRPAMYGTKSSVKNSYVANGAVIEGSVEGSIISRGVRIGKGAKIKNCIILADTVVEEGALIENALIDKHAHVYKDAELIGHKNDLIYVEQGKKIK